MSKKFSYKAATLTAGSALALTMLGAAQASTGQNPFGFTEVTAGYQLAANTPEGQCGEAKCGEAKAKAARAARMTQQEAKCGANKKAAMADQKPAADMAGEAKCGNKR